MGVRAYYGVSSVVYQPFRPLFLDRVVRETVFRAPVGQRYDEVRPLRFCGPDVPQHLVPAHVADIRPLLPLAPVGAVGEIDQRYPDALPEQHQRIVTGVVEAVRGGAGVLRPEAFAQPGIDFECPPEPSAPPVENMVVGGQEYVDPAVPCKYESYAVRGGECGIAAVGFASEAEFQVGGSEVRGTHLLRDMLQESAELMGKLAFVQHHVSHDHQAERVRPAERLGAAEYGPDRRSRIPQCRAVLCLGCGSGGQEQGDDGQCGFSHKHKYKTFINFASDEELPFHIVALPYASASRRLRSFPEDGRTPHFRPDRTEKGHD